MSGAPAAESATAATRAALAADTAQGQASVARALADNVRRLEAAFFSATFTHEVHVDGLVVGVSKEPPLKAFCTPEKLSPDLEPYLVEQS